MEALEVSGMPFSYFPVMMPQARGDHVIAPTPEDTKETQVRKLCMINSNSEHITAVPKKAFRRRLEEEYILYRATVDLQHQKGKK